MSIINAGKILQEIVVPELRDIKTDVATIKVEIKRLDEKIDTGLKRLDEKIDGVNEKVENLRRDMYSLKEEFRMAIDMHERIAAIETKLALH